MRRPGKYREPRYHDPEDLRLVEIIEPGRRARAAAVNIIGVPFDGAVLGRRGAAGGPEVVRGALSAFSNYGIEKGVSLKGARIVDLGDLVVPKEDVIKAHMVIEREVSAELRKDSMLVLLGGDNSISLPGLRAAARKFGRLGLVVVDSHLDLRGKIGGKPSSGSSYGLAMETVSGLDARRVVEIGAHGFLNSGNYVEKARRLGVKVVTAGEVSERGAEKVGEEAYDTASEGADAVYVSIDLDAVGLAEMAGVSAPSTGGLSGRELLDLAWRLGAGPKVKCADIVELAPGLDLSGRSQVVAASALVSLIGGFLSRTS